MRRSTTWAWGSFALAGLWHRRGIAIMVLATTILAAGAADVAFIYRAAAATSGLRARLTGASVQDSGLVVTAGGSPRYHPAAALNSAVLKLPEASGRVVGTSVNGYVNGPNQLSVPVDLLTGTGQCAQVRMVAGSCPRSGEEVAAPVGVAAQNGWKVGQPIAIADLSRNPNGAFDTDILGRTLYRLRSGLPPNELAPVRARLVGTYQVPQPHSAYWMGSPPVMTSSLTQALSATLLTTPHVFAKMPHFVEAQVFVDQPLRAATITTAEVPALRHALAAMAAVDPSGHLAITTQLPQLLNADRADETALGGITLVSVAQLLALLGLVLVVVLTMSSASRRTEIVAAGLQGRHLLRVAWDVAIEPILLILAGSALGALAAPVAVRLAVGRWLRAGTPVPNLPHESAIGVLAVAVGGTVAAAVIALLAARRTSNLQATREQRSVAAWWEVVVFTIAVSGLVELVTAGGIRSHVTPWALVSPTVCGLAVALLLARVLPPLLAPLVSRTRRTSRLSVYLLVRELRRDLVAWRVSAVVAMSVSLLAFAVAVDRGAIGDRQDRAGLTVGADQVVSVGLPSTTTLPEVVRRLDPDGQWAMAAVQVTPFGSPEERTLAVDASRLPAVAAWSRPIAGMSAAQLAKALQPTPTDPFRFTSSALELTIDNAKQHGKPVSLQLTYVLPSGRRRMATGPTVHKGPHGYSWPTPGCVIGRGCRLLSIGVPKPPQHQALNLTIGGLGLGAWVGDNAHVRNGGLGLHFTAGANLPVYGEESLVRAEAPKRIPALTSSSDPIVVGFDSDPIHAHYVAKAPAIPRLLNNGSIVDLSYLQLADTGAPTGTTKVQDEIWLGARAPANVLQRLAAMNVPVQSVQTRAQQAAALGKYDPALGLDAYIAVATLAVLLALALLCGQGAAAARRRRGEFVALATAGVSRFSLGCGWFAAAVVRLAFCVGAGATAGLFVARLAASGVPLAARGAVPTPILNVHVWPAVAAAVITLLPLVLVEAFSVRWSTRAVGLSRARETAT